MHGHWEPVRMKPSTSTFIGTTLSHLRRSMLPSTKSSGKRSLSLGIMGTSVISEKDGFPKPSGIVEDFSRKDEVRKPRI